MLKDVLPGTFHFVLNILGRTFAKELLELPDQTYSAQGQFRVTAVCHATRLRERNRAGSNLPCRAAAYTLDRWWQFDRLTVKTDSGLVGQPRLKIFNVYIA